MGNFLYQSHFLSLKTNNITPENKNMMMIEAQNPKLVLVKGIFGMFCPKMLAISVGGMKITETMVKILMILFC